MNKRSPLWPILLAGSLTFNAGLLVIFHVERVTRLEAQRQAEIAALRLVQCADDTSSPAVRMSALDQPPGECNEAAKGQIYLARREHGSELMLCTGEKWALPYTGTF